MTVLCSSDPLGYVGLFWWGAAAQYPLAVDTVANSYDALEEIARAAGF